jgi:predicted transcriptional regulator
MSKKAKTGTTTMAVKMPDELRKSVQQLADRKHLPEGAVMRLAIERGLPLIEKMFAAPSEKAA